MAVRFGSGVVEFYTVAKLKSFGAAAVELGLTQPTLSLAVKNLEESVGKKLIERTSRFKKLTPVGAAFYAHLNQLLPIFLDVQTKLVHGTLKKPGAEELRAQAEAIFKKEIPGPVKKPKEFRPTPTLSDDVCLMKADGWDEEKIAEVIGISMEQLKEHFPNELKHGVEQVRRRALRQLDKAAKKGNTSATNALLKLVGDMPTKFAPMPGVAGAPLPDEVKNPKIKTPVEPVLGKKEQAIKDAMTADQDSDWGSLVN